MLRLLLLASLSLFGETITYSIASHHSWNPFAPDATFEMGNEGKIYKEIHIGGPYYYLCDPNGICEAYGRMKAYSILGLPLTDKIINIYDERSQLIGFIEEEYGGFFDADKQWLATAYLDDQGFVILKYERPIAQLKRHTDHWEVVIYEPEELDLRLLKIFSAFALDFQE